MPRHRVGVVDKRLCDAEERKKEDECLFACEKKHTHKQPHSQTVSVCLLSENVVCLIAFLCCFVCPLLCTLHYTFNRHTLHRHTDTLCQCQPSLVGGCRQALESENTRACERICSRFQGLAVVTIHRTEDKSQVISLCHAYYPRCLSVALCCVTFNVLRLVATGKTSSSPERMANRWQS